MRTKTATPKLVIESDVAARDRSGCWDDGAWYHDRAGYGIVVVDGVTRRAHRYSLELDSGEEGGDRGALHSCDNPPCYNPAHLRWGSDADNVRDRDSRGRKAHSWMTKNGWTEKLDEATVVVIRERFARGGVTIAQLSREYGVTDATMGKAIHRKTWKWV